MKSEIEKRYSSETPTRSTEALGQSEKFLDFQERLSRVAPVNRPVLLFGERGTGKELAAGRLHYLSERWHRPFLTLNCSALSPSLIESELFGYEKGAFTGAVNRRIGRFEAADGGTLFLDEIGNIPLEVQEKILRVVEYFSFERVGSPDSIDVDVRIIAATNADLKALAADNRFKQDLLDRLSFEVLIVPPLRDRQEDILLLANYFAGRMAIELGWEEIPVFSPEAVKALENYNWPGNIRELKNVVERAVYRSVSVMIGDIVFDPFRSPYKTRTQATELPAESPDDAGPSLDHVSRIEKPMKEAVWDLKIQMLEQALVQSKFNQKKAAEILGLTYHQFRGLYRQHKSNVK